LRFSTQKGREKIDKGVQKSLIQSGKAGFKSRVGAISSGKNETREGWSGAFNTIRGENGKIMSGGLPGSGERYNQMKGLGKEERNNMKRKC